MTQPNFRRVQKKNPHQLVIDQHVHAAHCIRKFADEKGTVNVFDKSISQWVKRKSDAAIFCAKRAWDQRAEKGYMTDIENDFFHVIDNLQIPFNERNHTAISNYYHLWRLRGHTRLKRRENINLNGVIGEKLTKDEEETIESKHALFFPEQEGLPFHLHTGLEIQIMLDQISYSSANLKWGLITASRGEFLVADFYPGDEYGLEPFIPVSPRHIFYANKPDMAIDITNVRAFNRASLANAHSYYFCRDIRSCPC